METPLVLIVAYPGPLREGLHILLRTLTGVGAIQLLDNVDLLLRTSFRVAPDVIVWDWVYPLQDARWLLAQVRTRWPAVRMVALVADEDQEALALTVGVDVVLTQGTPALKLLATVNALVDEPQNGHYPHNNQGASNEWLHKSSATSRYVFT